MDETIFLYVASHIYLHTYKSTMHMQTYPKEYIYMHLKDMNVFMLSMISVAQQTYDHLANICHSTLQAVKYTWIYASTHLFLASNARMSPALIYTTHATQLLHSASSFHWGRHKKKTCFFFRKTPKGGGGVSPNPKFPYQKKNRFFWNF